MTTVTTVITKIRNVLNEQMRLFPGEDSWRSQQDRGMTDKRMRESKQREQFPEGFEVVQVKMLRKQSEGKVYKTNTEEAKEQQQPNNRLASLSG